MANNWTPEQLEAINERGCNLLVAAAAGSGKTAVLVERIIRKITDVKNPVDIDRLLVVTFTNAAATEMRERISIALSDALEKDPSSAHLQRQMTLLDRASIMTLHSFCLEVVKSHFHSLELDPVFRIADETECMLMKLDILENLFEEKYENEEPGSPFFQLVESYGGGRDDSALRELVLSLHRFTRSHPWPEQWLATQAEAYNTGASACLSSTPWARVLLKGAAAELQGLRALLGRAAARASRAQGLEPYCGVLAADMQKLDELLRVCEEAAANTASLGSDETGTFHVANEAGTTGDSGTANVLTGFGKMGMPRVTNEAGMIGDSGKDGALNDFGGTDVSLDTGSTSASLDAASTGVSLDSVSTGAPISTDGSTSAGMPSDPEWDAVHEAFCGFTPDRLPRCGKDADAEAQEEVKAARNLMKEKIRKLCESGFDESSAELAEDFGKLYPLFQYLSSMVCEFDSAYALKKKEKGLLDFSDLEHFCLKILLEDGRPSAAARELREKYEEILVDEYQDSNLIQELILGTVSGNQDGRYNLFMVGDVKQSIYRFRQARPELFLSKYRTFPHESGHSSRVIQLYKNFRSRNGVINGVNFIFRQVMSSMVGELDYTDEESLNPGAVFEEAGPGCTTGGPVEVHLIDVSSTLAEINPDLGSQDTVASENPDTAASIPTSQQGQEPLQQENSANGSPEQEEEPLDHIQAEARIVGRRIRELISRSAKGMSVYDKNLGGYRPAQFRDIVILMRATRNWSNVFVDELAAMGIPAYADTGLGYFRTVEIETVLSLLQIIDNPLQDIPMLAVLRSPIGNFSADELADIRLADRSASIFEAMKLFTGFAENPPKEGQTGESFVTPEEDNAAGTRTKTAQFLKRLQSWRDRALFTPVDELVWSLLNETGYYSYMGILPGGPERQANLRLLFERARQYEETSYRGLFNFIQFISKLRSGGGDMGSAKVIGESDNVVRIMSIHKSKGLEFPIVIVAGCGKKFNLLDLNAGILLHQDLGFGPDLVDLEKRTIYPSMPKYAIRQKLRLETLSEEMRILYVAFTRAKEKLILTGCIRDTAKTCAKWCSIADMGEEALSPYDMQQASNYLDWIGPAISRHPSARPIRQAASCGEIRLVQGDASCWDVKLWGLGSAAVGREEGKAAEKNIRNWLESIPANESAGRLSQMLEWQYPYKDLPGVPAKISVTELKRRFADQEQEALSGEAAVPFVQPPVAKPLFMETEKGLSAARRGTVMHFFMQHVDLSRLADIVNTSKKGNDTIELSQELKSQLVSMVAREQLTSAEADAVRIPAVCSFFESPVGRSMLFSPFVRRETPFNIEINCTEIYKELPSELYGNEKMLLQGVIDCWFESGDGLVLLDYKTDYVPDGESELIRERYKVQLDYYTRALETISGRKVAEKYLYLFYTGELLSC